MSRGLTIAVLKFGGTKPEASEVLMMLVICREENIKVFIQQFCRNGIKIA